MRKNFTYLFVGLFLLSFGFLNGQTLIWPLDTNAAKISQFNGGLNGWTTRGGTVDQNDNFFENAKIKWEWSAKGKRPLVGAADSATSTSTNNGLALFDAENNVTVAGIGTTEDMFGELNSPDIDVDGKNDLTLTYSSFFSNNGGQTFVTWSEDGGVTWKDTINVLQYVKAGVTIATGVVVAGNEYSIGTFHSSYTDDFVKLKLVGSKGTKKFKIKFLFSGFRFFWFVDDIELYQFDNDMQTNLNFFAIAPNYETPKNQVEPISFLSDISNQGNKSQPNVRLRMTVRNALTGSVVLSDSLKYGTIKADSTAENQLMAQTFTPSASTAGVFRATYRVLSDSTNQYRFNDTASTLFRTGDSIFRKEIGGVVGTRPSDGIWGTSNHSWSVGNYFYVPKGKSSTATKISARIANASALVGKTINAYLIKWKQPAVDSGFAREKDLTIIATGSAKIPVGAANFAFLDIPLVNENIAISGKAAYLEDSTAYIAMIEYIPTTSGTATDANMTMTFENRFDYGAMELATALQGPGKYRKTAAFGGFPTYTSRRFGANRSILTNDINFNLFGTDFIPVVRLTVVPFRVATNEVLSDANKMEVYPNPVQNTVTLEFDLEKSTDVIVRIVNINGQTVLDRQYGVTKTERTELNVSHLSNGTYLMQILTADGVKTKQFTIAK
jgi:Secretion system C-terminal sorting domain